MPTYKIIRSNRKTLSLKIVNSEVLVYAPLLYPDLLIEKFVLKHQQWIEKKITTNKAVLSFRLDQLSQVYILGKSYQLDLSISNKSALYLSGNTLFLTGKSLNVMANTYKKYLESLIEQQILEVVKECGLSFEYNFRFYKSRWGCCYKNKGLIVINSLAGCLDTQLIKSIIYHEIAHLKVSNHQKEFYDYLSRLDKDYRIHSKALKNYEIM